jgi:hypothetical protein
MESTLLHVRVELPTYNHSFTVDISNTGSIHDLKAEIGRVCTGQPRLDSQRVIWRGRLLRDEEKVGELWKVRKRFWDVVYRSNLNGRRSV